jgi:hypothetical protein
MTKDQAEFMTDLIAVMSTVMVETCRSMSRQSGGQISRHLVSIDIEKSAAAVPTNLKNGILVKSIMMNIAAQMADKPFTPVRVEPD